MNVIGGILMTAGVFLLIAGAIGYLRLPDFYTRMHAIGKSDTLGALLSLLGVATLCGWSLVGLKFLIAAVFIFIANPTATHALARAALLAGVEPWKREDGR
jgi:multicomponent Na+:H+ antiporter subunit G